MAITSSSNRVRKVLWEGNSLSNVNMNNTAGNGFYIPTTTFNNVKAIVSDRLSTLTNLAIGGRTQTQINADIDTNIVPNVSSRDIIVLWEGTNDLYANSLSGNEAFDNLVSYRNEVKKYGVKLMVATVIARDYATDPADLMARIGVYNSLVKAQDGILFDAVCRLDEDPLFDQRADASNTTYYNADKLHQATAGQNRVITLMTESLLSIV